MAGETASQSLDRSLHELPVQTGSGVDSGRGWTEHAPFSEITPMKSASLST
jgi:hypothetical protein